jgi:hypothetical protein
MTHRTMCKALAEALDGLSTVERAVLTTSARDGSGSPGWMRDLKIGLACQLLVGAVCGRQLNAGLTEALDNLDESARRSLARLVNSGEVEVPPWIDELLWAVTMQLEFDSVRVTASEDLVLAPFEADHFVEVEAADAVADWSHVPPPAPRTVAWNPEAAPDDDRNGDPRTLWCPCWS